MLTENKQKRAKNTNIHINNTTKQYQAPQSNNFRDIYINQSPTYFNQYRYEQEHKSPLISQFHYIQRQNGPNNYYEEEENLEKTMKNIKFKPEYFINEMNSMKNSMELEKNIMQRSVNTFTNKSPNKIGEKYYSQNDRKIQNYKEYGQQSYKEERYPPKYYRTNPLIQTTNCNTNINIENGEIPLKPVAQKICNITIQGGINPPKGKKMRSGKKRQKKSYMENMEIDENIPPGSAVPDKNINFNISATKSKQSSSSANYNDEENEEEENEEYENEEIEEKEEEIPMSEERKIEELSRGKRKINGKSIYQKRGEETNEEYDVYERNTETINKERDTLGDEQEIEAENDEEVEVDDDLEQEETEREPKITDRDEEQYLEGTTEQNRYEQIDQGEQIEQLEDDVEENNEQIMENENEEESNRINKGEIEEIEEEEQQQSEMTNNNINYKEDKNNLKLQKENDIKLSGKKENKEQKNNNKLNIIINDDNIQIIGEKKPKIFEINEESQLELLKKENHQLFDIEKVQSLEQPPVAKKKLYKKQIFNIIKNTENNVDIIHEKEQEIDSAFEMQKVSNFIQPRDKDRNKKIKNKSKNIKFKITKNKDSNFMLEKNSEEPELIIENVLYYEQSPFKKNKKKKNKLKIVKNKDGFLEIFGTPSLTICYENDLFFPKIYTRKKYKKNTYKQFKPSKRITHQYKPIQVINDAIINPKESRFMIRGKPKKSYKKGRNMIKREITYCYKSPISQELAIGGQIKNFIEPTTLRNSINNNLNINNEIRNQSRYSANSNNSTNSNRKIQSVSNSTGNNRPNLFNVYRNQKNNLLNNKEDKNDEKRREKSKTYKTTVALSSNLIKSDNEPIKQEYISIRRKYTNSRSNKNILIGQSDNNKINRFYIGSPGCHPPSSNDSSKEKIVKTEASNVNEGKKQILNFISSKREEKNDIENNKQNNNNNFIEGRNNILISKYEQYNKNQITKSENNNLGKTQSYFSNKSNNNKNETPKTPLSGENNNNGNFSNNYYNNTNNSNNNNSNYYNSYKNKSHTMSIFSNKEEPKNLGRTYISSNKANQRYNSNEQEKKEEENPSNVGRIYVSTTHNIRKNNNNPPPQTENKKGGSNNVNTIYLSTNFKKDKTEDKIENKSDNKELGNNSVFYSTSFTTKKPETKSFINNNNIFISSRANTSNINNIKEKEKNELKTNINRIMVNSSLNSPVIVKNLDNLSPKTEQNHMNRNLFNNININTNKSENIILNRNNIENQKLENDKNREEVKKSSRKEKIFDDKNENKTPENNKNVFNYKGSFTTSNYINSNSEGKNEDNNNNYNKNNYNKYNYSGNSQLSDFTKSYINSYMSMSSRPELSDFSKKFLNSNFSTNSYNRPELSNITRAYLSSQSPVMENDYNDKKNL